MSNERLPSGRGRASRCRILATVVLAITLTGLTAPATVALSAPDLPSPSSDVRVARTATTDHVQRAKGALSRATTQLHRRHPRLALKALATLRVEVRRAHRSATAQIGKPPTDPESDDVPGPPAVLATLGLDHRITGTLVPLFNRRHGAVVAALSATLATAHRGRNALLKRVVALPAEGAGDDYADGMSDTLGQYANEVARLKAALSTFVLTPQGARGLRVALSRARWAKTAMDKAYGGGE